MQSNAFVQYPVLHTAPGKGDLVKDKKKPPAVLILPALLFLGAGGLLSIGVKLGLDTA